MLYICLFSYLSLAFKTNKHTICLIVRYRFFGKLESRLLVVNELYLFSMILLPHIEYAHSVWNPFFKGNIENMEKVQKRATKLVISLKYLTYKERLEQLKLPTLKYRRARGDMTEVYKIIHNHYDFNATVNVSLNKYAATRGNKYKINNYTFHYNINSMRSLQMLC